MLNFDIIAIFWKPANSLGDCSFWVVWDNPRTCSTKSGVRWVTAVQAMHKINKLQDCGLDSTLLIETVQERLKTSFWIIKIKIKDTGTPAPGEDGKCGYTAKPPPLSEDFTVMWKKAIYCNVYADQVFSPRNSLQIVTIFSF